MGQLIAAIAFFVLAHLVPTAPKIRGWLIQRLGRSVYILLYSAVSLILILFVAISYRQAPYLSLWDYDPRLNWVPILVMPFAAIGLVVGALARNPLTVSFRRPKGQGPKQQADPPSPQSSQQHPGLEDESPRVGWFALTRHPLLWAFVLWAFSHIPPNGDLASVLLFALMGGMALLGMVGLDAKKQRALGYSRWQRLSENSPLWPWGPRRERLLMLLRSLRFGDWGMVAAGVGLYGALYHLHPLVIGVAP